MSKKTKGEFPDCGCHYTTDDDGIHFCATHKAAPDLLEACKTIKKWQDNGDEDYFFPQVLLDAAIAKAGI